MKKSVFVVFILVWCACFAAGQNDDLFRWALSEQNENRWHEISSRFGEKEPGDWDRIYSSWLWHQIEARIGSPDIQRFSDQLSEQAIRLTRNSGGQDNMSDSLASWRSFGQESLQEMYQIWADAAGAVYAQMAASLPDEVQSRVSAFFADYKNRVHKELETLFLAGERRFLWWTSIRRVIRPAVSVSVRGR